jgi:large subunit ribosomal protein L18
MAKTNIKSSARTRRKKHIRKIVHGTAERPRLSVFRSSKHIYAQIIDDESGRTITSASTIKVEGSGGNKEAAKLVGAEVAKRALAAKIDTVVFDRNGYLYHGRVAALADGAREAGLKF